MVFVALPGQDSNTEKQRRTWQWADNTGIIKLADSTLELYSNPTGRVAAAPHQSQTNTDDERRLWSPTAVPQLVIITLQDGKQLHATREDTVAVAYRNSSTNTATQRRFWRLNSDGTITLDDGKHLYIREDGFAGVALTDRQNVKGKKFRVWKNCTNGNLTLADGTLLHASVDGQCAGAAPGASIVEDVHRWTVRAITENDTDELLSGSQKVSIGKIMALSKARAAIISTPERSGRMPGPPFNFPVMLTIEKIVNRLAPRVAQGYDFAGSSSAKALKGRQPDCDMKDEDWKDKDKIANTQWAMYWHGHVHATVQTLLISSPGCPIDKRVPDSIMPGSKVLFAFSIAGGIITQTEFGLIPGILQAVKSDLCTRNIDSLTSIIIIWVHFDCITHLVRALAGFGTIDLWSIMNGAIPMKQAGVWTDGDYDVDGDLLLESGVPGTTPEERVDFILNENTGLTDNERHLMGAVAADNAELVERFLVRKADPNFKCAEFSIPDAAVLYAQPSVIRLLINAGMDMQVLVDYTRDNMEVKAQASQCKDTDMTQFLERTDQLEKLMESLGVRSDPDGGHDDCGDGDQADAGKTES